MRVAAFLSRHAPSATLRAPDETESRPVTRSAHPGHHTRAEPVGCSLRLSCIPSLGVLHNSGPTMPHEEAVVPLSPTGGANGATPLASYTLVPTRMLRLLAKREMD